MRYGYALPRPASLAPDALTVLGAGVLLWAIVFLLFTLRSFTLGLPYVGEQAGLRCIMMGVGAALCALLYLAANRVRGRGWPSQAAILGSAVIASGAFYSSANYTLLYIVAGFWPDNLPVLSVIVGYFVSTVWIFALWIALLFLLRDRTTSAGDRAGNSEASAEDRQLWVKQNGAMVRVRFEEIDWAESESDYVRLHVGNRSYLHRMTMEKLETLLHSLGFVRVHRRFLVPLGQVQSLVRQPDGRRIAILEGRVTVPVGRAYAARLRQLLSSKT